MWYSIFKFLLPTALLFASSLFAGSAIEKLTYDETLMTTRIRETAMPEMGTSNLEKILTRYYIECYGGREKWGELESLRVEGTLRTEADEFTLKAYQKKPGLMKLSVTNKFGTMQLGYDGDVAWKLMPNQHQSATVMEDLEARRFIHSAHFGSHLIFPYAAGKTISYLDTVPLDGNICHHIRVSLESGYQVDYFIDIRTFLEMKVVNTDPSDNTALSVVYKDYDRSFAMPIAKNVVSYEDGEFTSELMVETIKMNRGVMPWMFHMPK